MPDTPILCLANSRKHQGACIAGKLWDGRRAGAWVRPVADADGGALPPVTVRPGTVVEIPLGAPVPCGHQRENRLLGNGPWRRHGRLPWSRLQDLADPVAPLWQSGHHSTFGLNDRVPPGTATDSLRLIAVERLELEAVDGRKLRGRFRYGGQDYDLCVTDRAWTPCRLRRLRNRPLTDVLLCISLGEVFQGYCYKLIATIFWQPLYRP